MSPATDPAGARCPARMAYLYGTSRAPGLPPVVEHRSARCHLEAGHDGDHRATVPNPKGGKGIRRTFRLGARR